MLLSDFNYILPKELIAQAPLDERDSSRLLVLERKTQKISHCEFRDITSYLRHGDLLVLNNTKVIPARMLGYKKDTLGRVDVLLSKRLSGRKFKALIKPPFKIGQEVIFDHGKVTARLLNYGTIEFDKPVSAGVLNKAGVMPLPPYIKRSPGKLDNLRYQTVYAARPGAIASPTAGLHFTPRLLDRIRNKSVSIAYLTLHVGLGTFKPVKSSDIRSHILEPEEFSIPKTTINKIIATKRKRGRVFAVGTTTTRALETLDDGWLISAAHKGRTGLFIYPGYKFKMVDCLLTNFHLPRTTLFMLVCAIAGRDFILQAYQEAIKEKYRFYSYGDAMLII